MFQKLKESEFAQNGLAFFTLFGSLSTLICCALPALFVALGAGATFASLITRVPQLIWVSEHKIGVFLFAAVMMILGGIAQWNARNLPCPIDPRKAKACMRSRRVSRMIYFVSLFILIIGVGFSGVLGTL